MVLLSIQDAKIVKKNGLAKNKKKIKKYLVFFYILLTFAADYEHKNEKTILCLGAAIGVSADAGPFVAAHS